MDSEIRERRRKALKMHFDGTENWAEKLANEFDTTVEAVRKDWTRRNEWLEDLEMPVLSEAVDVCRENLMEAKLARQKMWEFYQNTNNPNCRLGALKAIERSARDHISILQSLGKLEKELGRAEIYKEDMIQFNVVSANEDPEEGEVMNLSELRETAKESKEAEDGP